MKSLRWLDNVHDYYVRDSDSKYELIKVFWPYLLYFLCIKLHAYSSDAYHCITCSFYKCVTWNVYNALYILDTIYCTSVVNIWRAKVQCIRLVNTFRSLVGTLSASPLGYLGSISDAVTQTGPDAKSNHPGANPTEQLQLERKLLSRLLLRDMWIS